MNSKRTQRPVQNPVRKRYEPVNLNLESVLPSSEKKHIDRYGYIISHLYEKRFLDNRWKELKRRSKRARKKQFVPLNAVIMRRILDKRHSKRILRNLCEWGVIEADNQYVVGKKSRSYRLTAEFADSDFRAVDYGRKFSAHLHRLLSEEKRKELSSLHKDIEDQIEANFAVDMGLAGRILKTLQLNKPTEVRTKLALDRMSRGDFGHTVSGKSGRYFNHLTNLKKELRQAILCRDGSRLVEVDIVNSQPFFLTFFLECIKRNVVEVSKIAEDWKVDTQSLSQVSSDKEFHRFKELTASGRLYDYVCKKTGLKRGVVKEEMFKTLFKPMYYTTEFEGTFQRLFPKVFEVVKTLKPKGAHNTLAILLQRMESMVVIDTLCDLMVVEGLPFIPIHDGVLVPKRAATSVAKVIRDVSYYYSRLKPTVKIKSG